MRRILGFLLSLLYCVILISCGSSYHQAPSETSSSSSNADDFQISIIGGEAVVIKYIGKDTKVEVPTKIVEDGDTYYVTSIHKSAFQGCGSIESLTLPFVGENLDGSGATHFGHIFGASSYEYNDDYVPKKLKEVIINSSLSIGSRAFFNCDYLKKIKIGNSITTIEKEAFESSDSLESVIIPSSVSTIKGKIFSDSCKDLKIYCESKSKPNGWYSYWYGSGAVYWGVTSLIEGFEKGGLKYSIINEKAVVVGYVGERQNLVIPQTIEMEGVTYDVTSIGPKAFYNASSHNSIFKSITISKNVVEIGEYAFYSCFSLESVTIGNNVTTIGKYAFYNCSLLTNIVIPISVTKIGSYAFENCSHLKIYCETKFKIAGWESNWSGTSPVYYGVTSKNSLRLNGVEYVILNKEAIATRVVDYVKNVEIPSTIELEGVSYNVTTIGSRAFYGCTLSSIKISDSVTTIGEYAFYYCYSLESVTISNNVTTIGKYAFSGCSSLTSIVIPNSVTEIRESVFSRCSSLASITLPFVGEKADGSGATNIAYLFGGTYNVDYVPTCLKEVIITGETKIADDAFDQCFYLTNIVISDNVTSIGKSAFYRCLSLISLTIGNSVTTIGEYAFSGCSALTKIIIPISVTKIENYAFSICSSLTIYCEAKSKPSGWSSDWNVSQRPVYWGWEE